MQNMSEPSLREGSYMKEIDWSKWSLDEPLPIIVVKTGDEDGS